MEILEIKQANDALAEMVALFRVELRSYKGIASRPNIKAGREEMEEYLFAKFPVYAALVDDKYAGYVVCRIKLKDGKIASMEQRIGIQQSGYALRLVSEENIRRITGFVSDENHLQGLRQRVLHADRDQEILPLFSVR